MVSIIFHVLIYGIFTLNLSKEQILIIEPVGGVVAKFAADLTESGIPAEIISD